MELFEKPVQVRVFVVVVEEALRKVDVSVIVSELVTAVFTVSYKEPGVERIDDKWISAGGTAILQLLCFLDIFSVYLLNRISTLFKGCRRRFLTLLLSRPYLD